MSTITLDSFSDDVEAVRQAAGLDQPVVLGHSQHAALALEYARRYPDEVRGVAAIAAVPPLGSEDGLEPAEEFFRRDASPERLAAHERNQASRPAQVATSEDFIAEYLSLDAMNWFDYSFTGAWMWEGTEVNIPVIVQLFAPEGLGRFLVEDFDLPVFLGLGRYDYRIPYYQWDKPRKRLSNHRYKLYENSAHSPPYEQPEEFTADLLDWAKTL